MKHVYLETKPGSGQFKYRGSVADKEFDPTYARAMGRSGLRVMVTDEPLPEMGGLANEKVKHVIETEIVPIPPKPTATELKRSGKGK